MPQSKHALLSGSGVAAAAFVGALAIGAGSSWAALLVVYFVGAVALTTVGARRKMERTGRIVAKVGSRDAGQVLANGGAFATAALGQMLAPSAAWAALALGSLAASAADTWSTEVGTLVGDTPRSILTGRRVPAGTSGGVSMAGTAASFVGSSFIATTGLLLGFSPAVCSGAAIAGAIAATLDSVLGAALQERRWCDTCDLGTERVIHWCGAPTRHAGGVARFDNDGVNFVTTLAGGLLAALLAR
jgi:uncharacterized protein (TIGR00297 family)